MAAERDRRVAGLSPPVAKSRPRRTRGVGANEKPKLEWRACAAFPCASASRSFG